MIKSHFKVGNYTVAWGAFYLGVIKSYEGDDATAGLHLSRSVFYVGKRV